MNYIIAELDAYVKLGYSVIYGFCVKYDDDTTI